MIDIKKLLLYLVLAVIVFLLWNRWQEFSALVAPEQPEATIANEQSPGQFVPQVSSEQGEATTPAAQSQPQPSSGLGSAIPPERTVHIKTDVLDVMIDVQGGTIYSAKLLDYQQAVDDKNNPYVLFNDEPDMRYLAQSGVVQADTATAPRLYNSESNQYELKEGQNQLEVVLNWQDNSGLNVQKIFKFERGSYLIDVDDVINNQSSQTFSGSVYNQLLRVDPKHIRSGVFDLTAYVGASISDPAEKLYQKISFKQMRKTDLNRMITGGWLAMQEHYFLSAWVPNAEQRSRYYTDVNQNDEFTIGLVGSVIHVDPGSSQVSQSKLYVGPEIGDVLENIAPGLNLTIDYGWLWFISIFLFKILRFIHGIVGNWGWSIVIVTILVKGAFYWLSAKSYRSMANMRKLQPRLNALKERHKDDKAKFSQAMMELYRKEKINPLGGCLPILVQIPVFIALYWVLLESVELRQAPFILWIHDLSSRDPYYVLPILMGLTMFVQQRLSPPPPDPTQAKMMMFLPVFFTFLFLHFPAGLVLYWTVNNSLSILQQWYVMRSVEKQGNETKRNHKR